MDRVVVTGGAGFIGRSLVKDLCNTGCKVTILDKLSDMDEHKMEKIRKLGDVTIVKTDLSKAHFFSDAIKGSDLIYHLAANTDVRIGAYDSRIDYEQNILTTYNLLHAMREGDINKLIFTSSSTVYGEATIIPTPESYGPMKPISLYGASKLASESLISGFSHMFGFTSVALRLANVIGPDSEHGIIHDFHKKLQEDQSSLQILGSGEQKKSYLHISDCVDAFRIVERELARTTSNFEATNVGTDDSILVTEIANSFRDYYSLEDLKFKYQEGTDGRGWHGDVRTMILETTKLKKLGWTPKFTTRKAVEHVIEEISGIRNPN